MKERFEGNGRVLLVEAVKRQEFVGGSDAIAEALVGRGELVEFRAGERVIIEGSADDAIYLLLIGNAAVVVKGNQIAERRAGEHVGEMDAIEPSLPRAA